MKPPPRLVGFLALLEAILLLADHRTSEAEQRDFEKEIES